MSKQPFAIDDVGSQIKEAVKNSDDSFEHALVTTYTVTPGYLDWFDDLDTLVCAPSDAADEIRLSDSVDTDGLSILERDVHGKCVVVWGSDRIVAWAGSFNLSHAGLFTNVEWASRFEGAVRNEFTVDDIREGRIESTLTNNERITQLIDTVQSLVQRTPSKCINDALRRWPTEPIIVHSGIGNSLRRSVKRCLSETDGEVTLSYFAPNVNKTGVRAFTSLAPSHLSDDQLTVELYGAQPSAVIDTTQPTLGSFVGTADVRELEEELGEFVLRTRLPGDDGETLPSGNQIRGGLAHLKALVVSETDGEDEVIKDVLLTSANLTANAWSGNDGNVEYGIWLRDPERIESVGEFFLDSLAECYGRADERTLTDIDERIEAGSGGFLPYTRRSIGDLIATQLQVSSTGIAVNWPDDEVQFDVEQGRWYLRNIVTREIEMHDATSSSNIGCIKYPAEEQPNNRCIESLKVQVTTPLETPIYELSADQLTQLANGTLDEPVEDWDRLFVDGTAYATDSELPHDVFETADTGFLYRCHDRSLTRTIQLNTDHLKSVGFNEPYLPETAITDATAATLAIDGLGNLPCIDVEFATGISPPSDSIDFETTTESIEPVGWMNTSHGHRYVFEPTTSSQTITVSPGRPLDVHYPDEHHDCTLPSPEVTGQTEVETTLRRLQQVRSVCPRYSLAEVSVPDIPDVDVDIDPFIHENSSLEISLDTVDDLNTQTLAYESIREGYFYDPPTKHDCAETFTPPAPYSKLTIRGLLGIGTDTEPVWLYTDETTIDTRKQLITTLNPSADIPKELPFTLLDPEQAIMWLGFDFEDLVVEDVGDDASDDFVFECWRGETKLEQSRPIRALIGPPRYFAVPLFRSLLEESVTYRVVVRPSETRTKYAWSADEYEINLERRSRDTLKLVIEGQKTFEFEISDDDAAPQPMIDLDRLSKVRLGEEFRYHSCLDNDGDEWRPETIKQTSEVILQFVEGQ